MLQYFIYWKDEKHGKLSRESTWKAHQEAEFEVHSLDGLSQIFSVSLDKSPSQPVPPCSGVWGYRLAVISQGCVEENAVKHLYGIGCVVRDSIYKLRQRKPKH